MSRSLLALIFATTSLARAQAATLSVDVKDRNGTAARDAVVMLAPENPLPGNAPRLPARQVIDQRHETFLPLVVLIPKGGNVVFTNNDTTKHQVYSFSPIRQFQFVVAQGETSQPVDFPRAGIAAIGCNIHDQMIAYVFVAETPFAAVAGGDGRVAIRDVPDGRYRLVVWHPQMGPELPSKATDVQVAGDMHTVVALPLSIEPMRGMKHMHMDY